MVEKVDDIVADEWREPAVSERSEEHWNTGFCTSSCTDL